MISLIKKIYNSDISIFFRNNIGYKKKHRNLKNDFPTTVSDAFCWRTDKNYTTYFRFNDILKSFFNISNSFVVLKFYLHDGTYLKKIKIEKPEKFNEIIIDKKFFEKNYLREIREIESHGTFYVFHHTRETFPPNIISNRCYVGYSLNNSLPSFVHGNTPVKYKKIQDEDSTEKFLVKSTIFCNNKYKIQKSFLDIHNTELFFANPLSKTLKLKIFNKKINLFEGQSIIFALDSRNEVSFASNSVFLRPLIFSYNNKGCIDVLHS
jgi:hypothetical protein